MKSLIKITFILGLISIFFSSCDKNNTIGLSGGVGVTAGRDSTGKFKIQSVQLGFGMNNYGNYYYSGNAYPGVVPTMGYPAWYQTNGITASVFFVKSRPENGIAIAYFDALGNLVGVANTLSDGHLASMQAWDYTKGGYPVIVKFDATSTDKNLLGGRIIG